MSSPGGRRKFLEMQRRKQTGHSNLTSPSKNRASQLLDDNTEYVAADDDDEEMLELKLAAIDARLKLKKLQQQNGLKSKLACLAADSDGFRPRSQDSRIGGQFSGERKRKIKDVQSQDDVQVPLSPTRKPAVLKPAVSPRRVMLGIDKGLKGSQVSLRRPPESREFNRPGSALSTTRLDATSRTGTGASAMVSQSFPAYNSPKIKSFSERLRESRSTDKAKWEKAQYAAQSRSTGFGVDRRELDNFKAAAEISVKEPSTSSTTGRLQAQEFNRDEIMHAYGRPRSPLRRSKTISTVSESRPSSRGTAPLKRSNSNSEAGRAGRISELQNTQTEERESHNKKTPDPSRYEPFSGLHLSKRILPHSYVTRKTESMKRMRIPDLLRTVKGPDFATPDTDGDYVIFGIVASKSTPKEHKEKQAAAQREKDPYDDGLNNTSKYMVLTLSDLKWSIDLFLFATAFPKYYKMSPGTLVAILNPSIMPPPPKKTHTNCFSLTISSSEDTILEIGTAQDISFCKAMRKDGRICDAWVDGRKTEFCDFHVDIQLRKTTAQRMEVNSGPGFGLGPRSGRFGNRGGHGRGWQENGLRNEGATYDRSTGSTYYVAPPVPRGAGSDGFGHRSAAGLIDADNPFVSGGDLFHRRGESQGDRFRKRLADQERERNIARRLGELKSVGSEYLRAQHSESSNDHNIKPQPSTSVLPSSSTTSSSHPRRPEDAQSARDTLGLDKVTKNANNVQLGRIRKRDFESSSGGGGAIHNNTGRSSPVKKTRFITAKGIREAGRESLGTNPGTYSDDDLDIVT
ncbi:hypothetical protein PRK78_000502 [Emydomyces testavorans]|uniref:Zinc finger Mcm10/DnaG-type domain-containing protein n=1 Tax=Emydomyces testavorans TaxID=2070801 RepID=A0AAF0DAU9_9EURO|nr:hypothetical protein PRK78_000502 [Emydomyces testavorans]